MKTKKIVPILCLLSVNSVYADATVETIHISLNNPNIARITAVPLTFTAALLDLAKLSTALAGRLAREHIDPVYQTS